MRLMRERFPLTSEQLELLLAFEAERGLQPLSRAMAKDVSVVSRNLQRLADTWPVLEKVKGRWALTPLGREVNERSRIFLSELRLLAPGVAQERASRKMLPRDTTLIIINAQRAWERKIPRGAEENLIRVLDRWRDSQRKVVHVRHSSENVHSSFHPNQPSSAFLPHLEPRDGETVVCKKKSSAFADTDLLAVLQNYGTQGVVIAGFTANDCVDATARAASELGLEVTVLHDASATFDIVAADGSLFPAERLHEAVMANIHALFATVCKTAEVISSL